MVVQYANSRLNPIVYCILGSARDKASLKKLFYSCSRNNCNVFLNKNSQWSTRGVTLMIRDSLTFRKENPVARPQQNFQKANKIPTPYEVTNVSNCFTKASLVKVLHGSSFAESLETIVGLRKRYTLF